MFFGVPASQSDERALTLTFMFVLSAPGSLQHATRTAVAKVLNGGVDGEEGGVRLKARVVGAVENLHEQIERERRSGSGGAAKFATFRRQLTRACKMTDSFRRPQRQRTGQGGGREFIRILHNGRSRASPAGTLSITIRISSAIVDRGIAHTRQVRRFASS